MKSQETVLVVLCAWCGKFLGVKDGEGVAGTSHGICPDCARPLLEALATPQAQKRPAA